MERSKALTHALSYLITSQPFIAVLLMDLLTVVEVPADSEHKTAATDDKHIFLNTEWFGKLTTQEGAFVIAHEVLHVVYQHLPRGKVYANNGVGPDFKKYSHQRMNKATDLCINGVLVESSIGAMPHQGLYDSSIGGADNADDVYCTLPYEEDKPGQTPAGFDKHLDPATQHAPGAIKAAVAGAANAAKAQGTLPAGLARLAGELLEPEQDWKELLRDFMVTTMGHDTPTWSRLNRRKLAVPPHVAFPGTLGWKAGNVAIVVDTSGSIGAKELSTFMAEVGGILGDCVPEQAQVFWTDSKVAGIDEVDEYTDLTALEPKGGGGTAMHKAFPVVDETFMGDVSCCVILTDGYTQLDVADTPAFPVLWCMTTDQKAPYGQNVQMKVS